MTLLIVRGLGAGTRPSFVLRTKFNGAMAISADPGMLLRRGLARLLPEPPIGRNSLRRSVSGSRTDGWLWAVARHRRVANINAAKMLRRFTTNISDSFLEDASVQPARFAMFPRRL